MRGSSQAAELADLFEAVVKLIAIVDKCASPHDAQRMDITAARGVYSDFLQATPTWCTVPAALTIVPWGPARSYRFGREGPL